MGQVPPTTGRSRPRRLPMPSAAFDPLHAAGVTVAATASQRIGRHRRQVAQRRHRGPISASDSQSIRKWIRFHRRIGAHHQPGSRASAPPSSPPPRAHPPAPPCARSGRTRAPAPIAVQRGSGGLTALAWRATTWQPLRPSAARRESAPAAPTATTAGWLRRTKHHQGHTAVGRPAPYFISRP